MKNFNCMFFFCFGFGIVSSFATMTEEPLEQKNNRIEHSEIKNKENQKDLNTKQEIIIKEIKKIKSNKEEIIKIHKNIGQEVPSNHPLVQIYTRRIQDLENLLSRLDPAISEVELRKKIYEIKRTNSDVDDDNKE